MKTIHLEIRNNGGCNDSRHDKHFADGKRITRAEYDTIKRDAVTLRSESGQTNGAQWFHTIAEVSEEIAS